MQEKHDAKTDAVRGRYRTLLIIWVVILWSTVALTGIPLLARRSSDPAPNRTLFWAILALCLLTALGSFVLKAIFLRRAEREKSAAIVQQAYILSFALCESSCLFGLMAYFTGAARDYYWLFIPGLVCMLLNMPRRERLERTLY